MVATVNAVDACTTDRLVVAPGVLHSDFLYQWLLAVVDEESHIAQATTMVVVPTVTANIANAASVPASSSFIPSTALTAEPDLSYLPLETRCPMAQAILSFMGHPYRQ